jgi:hypothetical protein
MSIQSVELQSRPTLIRFAFYDMEERVTFLTEQLLRDSERISAGNLYKQRQRSLETTERTAHNDNLECLNKVRKSVVSWIIDIAPIFLAGHSDGRLLPLIVVLPKPTSSVVYLSYDFYSCGHSFPLPQILGSRHTILLPV